MIEFKTILDYIPEGIAVIKANAPKYTMVYANKMHLKNIGLTEDQFIGRSIFDLFPDSNGNLAVIESYLKNCVERKEVQKPPMMQYNIPGPNGEIINKYWSLIYVPIIDVEGEVMYIVQSAIDITNVVQRGEHLGIV